MAKVQSRRSVSLNREVHERALAAAQRCEMSLSKFTEIALGALIQCGPTEQTLAPRVVADDPAGGDVAIDADAEGDLDWDPIEVSNGITAVDNVTVIYDDEAP